MYLINLSHGQGAKGLDLADLRGAEIGISKSTVIENVTDSLLAGAGLKPGEANYSPILDIGLRVYVYSGGCSGFRYGMMLEEAPTAEDRIMEANGVRVYVDASSVRYLEGAQIDYVDTLMGAGFTVNNPNSVAACGCGSSFRTTEDAGSPRSCAH